MELILTIENETSLPNGSPVSVRLGEGDSLDIGRSALLDWPLPDDSRFISGKHCEVRHRDGAYWLYDVSTNGTFVNDEPERMQAAHRLRQGDRIVIGPYVIVVTVEGEDAGPQPGADTREVFTENAASSAPVVVTEVAPRAPDSVFDLELERQAPPPDAPIAPVMPAPPVVEEKPPAAPRPAVFRPGRRAPGPLVLPFEDDDPVPVWSKLTGGSNPAPSTEPAGVPSASIASTPSNLEQPVAPAVAAPPVAVAPAGAAGASVGLPRVSTFEEANFNPAGAKKAEAALAAPAVQAAPTSQAAPASRAAPAESGAAAAQHRPGAATGGRRAEAGVTDETATAAAFIRRFAKGAGVPEQVFARRDPLEVAEELGVLMHLVADNLKQLLSARHEAKRLTRSGNQTMIQALDNNPLKFAPNVDDALKIMLGPRTRSYLDARRTLETAFQDLKTHQIETFSAMQGAVKMLLDDLDPQEIEAAVGTEDSGLSGWLGNRKNRLWDVFVARWQAKTIHHPDGIVGAFMLYFSECYDREND